MMQTLFDGKLWTALALLALAGCARSGDHIEVTGNVTWNDTPIPTGMVVLQPLDPKTAPAGGQIRDGKFRLHSKPGKMRVQIEAVRATDQIDPETGTKLGEMYVPPRYNTQTELEADVTIEGDNHFEFALKE
jgi:hypothetical protein